MATEAEFQKLLDADDAVSLAVARDYAETHGRWLEWLVRAAQIAFPEDYTRPGVTTSYVVEVDGSRKPFWYASLLRYADSDGAKHVVLSASGKTMADAHRELVERFLLWQERQTETKLSKQRVRRRLLSQRALRSQVQGPR